MGFLAALAPAIGQTRTIEGNYTGTLQAGEAQLHLVLHLTKTANGSLHASLDSLDQGVYAIEVTSVHFLAPTLRLEIANLGVHFEGKVTADREHIDGEWSQGGASLMLSFQRKHNDAAAGKSTDTVAPVEGIWQGAIETHGLRLRLQLHVSHDTEGELVAALDSLDQGVSGLPAIRVEQKEASFHFEIPSVGGVYEGTLLADKNKLAGSWTQTGTDSMKLEFKRSDQPLELRRPQNPVKPFPYREEEISFANTAAQVTLFGTLSLPPENGPFPAVLLIAGSGPQDRDEFLANHRPFLVIADFLARKGIAVLRYDKRGIGKSQGSAASATTLDLAADAQAAIAYLKSRKEIDPTRIGLLGHSEGAIIAPYLASRSADVAWLVLLAPAATNGQDTLLNQSELIGRVGGLDDAQLLASLSFDRAAYDLVRQEKDPVVLSEKVKALVKESGLAAALPPAALESQLAMLLSPWFRFFLDYDPLPNLRTVKQPVLALFGQKDLQVPAKQNMPLVQKALQDAGNAQAEVREMPELNHLFQHAYAGSPAEYAAIEETISPQVLQLIGEWIQHRSTK